MYIYYRPLPSPKKKKNEKKVPKKKIVQDKHKMNTNTVKTLEK